MITESEREAVALLEDANKRLYAMGVRETLPIEVRILKAIRLLETDTEPTSDVRTVEDFLGDGTRVGDLVWFALPSERDDTAWKVVGVDREENELSLTTGNRSITVQSFRVTHRRPLFGADGAELREGDVVRLTAAGKWHVLGEEIDGVDPEGELSIIDVYPAIDEDSVEVRQEGSNGFVVQHYFLTHDTHS